MSRKRKRLYSAVVLACGSALGLDSLVVSGDLPQAGVPTKIAAASSKLLSEIPDMAIPELPFPKGITPVDPSVGVRDLFAPPQGDRESSSGGPDADKPGDVAERLSAPGRLSSAVFANTHRLSGIMLDERLRIAGVDDRWIGIGASVQGCTLTDISAREAKFRCFDNEVVLTLDCVEAGTRR